MNTQTRPKYMVGDVVVMARHPTIKFVVLKHMVSPVRHEHTYVLRFLDTPEDTRGSLIWEDAIAYKVETEKDEVQS